MYINIVHKDKKMDRVEALILLLRAARRDYDVPRRPDRVQRRNGKSQKGEKQKRTEVRD